MKRSSPPAALVYGALVLQTLISSGTYLAAKRALVDVPWPALLLLRNVGAAGLFIPLFLVTAGPVLPPGRHRRRVVLLGVLAVPLNQALFLAGLTWTTPAHAALLYTLTPALVLAWSVAAGQERFEGRKLAGLALALGGAALVVLERAKSVGAGVRGGDILVFGAVLAWAAFTVLGKPLVESAGPVRATGWALMTGALFVVPAGARPLARVPFAHLHAAVWASLAFLVLLTSFVSYLCWYFALAHVQPSQAAVFTNLQPVLTAAASWALFEEPITPRLVLGGAAVIAGVLVATRARALRARWRALG